jgi:hypothetical protein
MQDFYKFLNDNNYFWDRKNDNTIWVALNGYKIFDERYMALEQAARAAKATIIAGDFDSHCGKTFYSVKHK